MTEASFSEASTYNNNNPSPAAVYKLEYTGYKDHIQTTRAFPPSHLGHSSSSSSISIDLHYLNVRQAIAAVRAIVSYYYTTPTTAPTTTTANTNNNYTNKNSNKYRQANNNRVPIDRKIGLIVGTGKHSSNGKARLKPNVVRFLSHGQYRFSVGVDDGVIWLEL